MAIDIDEYVKQMQNLQDEVNSAIGIARRRQGLSRGMKEIADAAGNQSLRLNPEQRDALLDNQLALTQALKPILDAAIVALTP